MITSGAIANVTKVRTRMSVATPSHQTSSSVPVLLCALPPCHS